MGQTEEQPQILDEFVIPWFRQATTDYELIYLDPNVCAMKPEQRGFLSLLRVSPKKGTPEGFIREIDQLIQATSSQNSPNEFFDDDGIGSIVRKQRVTQRKFSTLINKYGKNGAATLAHLKSVADFRQKSPKMLAYADKRSAESLVMIDAMFATSSALPTEIVMTQSLSPERRYGSMRRLEGVLLDIPPRFAMFGDAVVPLMMDSRVTSNWTVSLTTMMSAGWYPTVRVVGFLATASQSHCYIDVIAILARPWPDAAKLFHTNEADELGSDLTSLLEQVSKKHLEPIFEPLNEDQAVSSAQDATRPSVSFGEYKDLLSPIQFAQLLAYLNGVHGSALKLRAPKTYQEIGTYLEGMKRLYNFLDESSQLILQDQDLDLELEKLLPEPVGWHKGKKVPLEI